jgi:hypothetical protein
MFGVHEGLRRSRQIQMVGVSSINCHVEDLHLRSGCQSEGLATLIAERKRTNLQAANPKDWET